MRDAILIEQLELETRIGVPDEERAKPQRLTVSLRIEPRRDFGQLDDDLANTIDYQAVCHAIKALSTARPRRLVETLAEEIASLVLENEAVAAVEVELHKFVLTDTAFVAVRLRRES